MINTIIFDIGNVLVDFRWKEFIDEFDFSDEVKERIGKAAMDSPDWNDIDLGVAEDVVLRKFIKNDPGIEKELREVFNDMGRTISMFDTTIPWLKELKGQGYRRLILSNLSAKTVRECAKDLEFFDHVDGGILSYRVGIIKPDRRIYELLISRYGLNPDECIFLDDRKENIETAEKLGIHGIVFKDRPSALTELESFGIPESRI